MIFFFSEVVNCIFLIYLILITKWVSFFFHTVQEENFNKIYLIDLQFTALGFKICWIITLGFVSSETTAIWKWLQQYLTVCKMYVSVHLSL